MSAPAPISTVPARLPYLDRRALSEAWYAALHLARAERATSTKRRVACPARSDCHPRTHSAIERAAGRHSAPGRARRPREAQLMPGSGGVRVRAAAPSGERVVVLKGVKAPYARPRAAHAQADVTLTLDGASVRFIARRDGGRTILIAFCGTQHIARIRRALGLLEGTLRARGERLEAAIRPAASFERRRTA